MKESGISAVLLAAGLSLRMGEDKLLMQYRGVTMLQRAVDLLAVLHVYEKILVTTKSRLDFITLPPDIVAIINPQPESGQSGSVRLGVTAASGGWYFFMVADQPGLTSSDLRQLIDNTANNEGKIIYPVINGNPSAPVLFPSRFRNELLDLSGDAGGRVLRARHPEACAGFEPKYPERFIDIDCAGDFERLKILSNE